MFTVRKELLTEMSERQHRRFFTFGFGFPFPGFFWAGRPWRFGFGFPGREEYRQMLEDYRRELEEEIKRVEEELERLRGEG